MTSDSWTPVESIITAPNVNDIEIGRQMPIAKGQVYVFDKGYCDYNWWYQIHCSEACVVTRLKSNAGINLEEDRTLLDPQQPQILGDHLVSFKHRRPGGKRINEYYGTPFRKVTVERKDGRPALVLATNDLETPAHIIAERYKARWGIELFFKWLKQNLKIRKFLGRSENAVKVQIFTALITYLLLQMNQTLSATSRSLRHCLTELRAGLFQRKETDHELLCRRQRQRLELQRIQGALPL